MKMIVVNVFMSYVERPFDQGSDIMFLYKVVRQYLNYLSLEFLFD